MFWALWYSKFFFQAQVGHRGPLGSGPRAKGSKFESQIWDLFLKPKLGWPTPLSFCHEKKLALVHPRGPRAPGNSGKSPVISGSLNKKLEFGLGP